MKRSRKVLVKFEDGSKRELERWLLIDHRLREIAESLNEVHRSMGRTRRIKSAGQESVALIRSHYCFAAVTYMRCFSGGRHRKLSIDSIPGITAKNLETHMHVREIRNTFFAHAVADEEAEHVFLLAPEEGKTVTRFGVISIVMLSDSKQRVRDFMRLVAKVRKYVETQSEILGDRIASRFFGKGASWRELSGMKASAQLSAWRPAVRARESTSRPTRSTAVKRSSKNPQQATRSKPATQ